MNSVELKEQLVSMIPDGGKYARPVYREIINAIMKYYMWADVSTFDWADGLRVFQRFLDSDVLQFS